MKDGIIYIAFTIGLIPIIQKIFNFSGKASMYETTQKSYDAITEKIIEEIADKKNDPVHFMQDINKEIRFVNKKAPNVYGFVLKKFANKFKKMATPITLDQIDIFIDVDNEDSTEPKEEKKNTNEQKEQKELSETIEDSRQLLSKEFESRLDKRTGTNSAFGFELRRYEEQ
jgi:hypothetical protein